MRGTRASQGPDPHTSNPTEVVVARRRLPRTVVWLLWLVGALLGSVVLGFLAGLARPREPDPWTAGPAEPDRPTPGPVTPGETTSSDPTPLLVEDD